ncbi:PREDICTED: probable serine/threonine-protein kinase At1g54610 isoform X1 [Lupinus angustifolius]|uniref:probable serine/threonine-protein kinase At1g54610 isoform X1 n=1 Tax=Lupinus angustifolius TaxID=3871 RepID=UPI00092EEB5A|nr:PREDICTED: probable serine/threonine-protein kinase At1g54610 isoform X1 [Lupinus angustifolius]
MGCISSKNVVARRDSSLPIIDDHHSVSGTIIESHHSHHYNHSNPGSRAHSGSVVLSSEEKKKLKKNSSRKSNGSFSFRIGLFSNHRYVDAEQNAAGWPPWLTASAAEAIQGWIPLKADSFQKLDKIGQGTYSSVFQAREVESGRMFALKKVRFDNLQPESIRFMAREITILRRLDHPNIMKLEGIITSRQSNSIYLVFEYMEHDLAGLVSRPDIMFTDSQIKCYMRQLLSGIEHCHVRGIMHRDIKVSNILVNNDGILKIADFGLANTISPNNKHPLTSRVVTLWYRPPELLMGSTNYGVSVDLWSVGCVFAELYLGKPILKGRTEVEQLHKIFKLCGTPSDEYWKRIKLPHATMFKPQTTYESSLRERCADFPETAVSLLETFLSIDPYKRGTASSALMSEYFNTMPYACSPSNLPKYPPSKEMDAKNRGDASRKKTGSKMRESATSRRQQRRVYKVSQEPKNFHKTASKEDMQNIPENSDMDDRKGHLTKGKAGTMHKEQPKHSVDTMSEASQNMNIAMNGMGYSVHSGQVQAPGSSGFTWAKRRKPDVSSTLSDGERSKISALDPNFAKGTYDLTRQAILERKYNENHAHRDETSRHVLQKHQAQHGQQKVQMDFDPSELLNPQGYKEYSGHWNENGLRHGISRFGRDK